MYHVSVGLLSSAPAHTRARARAHTHTHIQTHTPIYKHIKHLHMHTHTHAGGHSFPPRLLGRFPANTVGSRAG